jgi:hypothetical protein
MQKIPWYIWLSVLGVTSAMIGVHWDISWHRSIGRDTFWTPAHMAIQLCGVIAGITCGYLILWTTFATSSLRAASVNVLGFRAPLGAFICAWGGFTMITSAPFDDWWHNAYGLDVKIVSPPHTLLILGIRAVSLGVFFLILATMNRANAEGARSFSTLQKLLLYLGGLTVGGQMFFLQEFTFDVQQHRALAYIATAIAVPVVLAMLSQASRFRWAATVAAAVYMAFIVGEILIFPLFPAQPKLGPVYFPVTHLVPANFPILLVVPALALDLVWRFTARCKLWQVALVSGLVFVAVLVMVQWPFADFLMSKASENRLFGTMYFDYGTRPDSEERLRHFFRAESGLPLMMGLLRASVYAAVSTWFGLLAGRWMRGVQR